MARCPGQDQRFWKPEDIFEIKCPECGVSVEFWKDEPQVKCPKCKHTIVNPKLDLGCAKWCQYAQECLGMINKQENTILSNKLIECLRQIADIDQDIIHDSLEVLRYAERILVKEGGEPLVVKSSAIFSHTYQHTISQKDIRDVLNRCGIHSEIINQVCQILDACRSAKALNSIEFKIIWDSFHLAQFHRSMMGGSKVNRKIVWKTQTGRQLAEELYSRE